MEKYIKLFLMFLMLKQFECQVNIFGINGPAVIENVSNYNEKGATVVNVINGFENNENSPKAPKEPNGPGDVSEVSLTVAASSPIVSQQTSSVTPYEVSVVTPVPETMQGYYPNNAPVVNAESKDVNSNVESNKYSTTRSTSVASQHKTTNPHVVKKKEESSQHISNGKHKFNNHLSHNPTTNKPDDTKIYFPKS